MPDYGGTLTEGVVGSARFINPILASSDSDKDLTNLIYTGLLRPNANDELVPALAESYTVSPDSLVYTFVLRDDIYFHDGTKITADDVIFTIEKAQDPMLKSPREANWSGVKAEKIDDKTITFTLKQPYSPFIQNTTLGILPKHIWKNTNIEEFPFSQYNTKPVGSGPYKIDSIAYASSGMPSEYHLVSFKDFVLGRPYISKIVIKSYSNEKDIIDAYKNGDIESVHGLSTKQLPTLDIKDGALKLSPLPRVFGVFFNQNAAPVLVHKEVREALNLSANKQEIVDTVIGGYGQPIDSPVPIKAVRAQTASTTSPDENLSQAKNLLENKGWKLNEDGIYEKKDKSGTETLAFSISTGDAPELKETAFLLQKQWQKLGADVEIKVFEIGDLNQNIIRTRKYDSLLFGEVVGRDMDLYPFWHSSQRTFPGLNIAVYTNIKVDKTLENLRKATNSIEQNTYFESFGAEIKKDVPAVFTYSPYFIYIVPKKINEVKLGMLASPSERWNSVNEWYIETNDVWKIFAKKQ